MNNKSRDVGERGADVGNGVGVNGSDVGESSNDVGDYGTDKTQTDTDKRITGTSSSDNALIGTMEITDNGRGILGLREKASGHRLPITKQVP